MNIILDLNSVDDYKTFLRVKQLPTWSIRGREISFPDEYAERLGLISNHHDVDYHGAPKWMLDYQGAITATAIAKRKYSLFMDCGLGKTAIFLEFGRVALDDVKTGNRGVLMVSPLMVIPQTIAECKRFFGDSIDIEHIKSSDLSEWTKTCGGKFGITNFEAIKDGVEQGRVGCLIIDESSMMKSHYGKWGTKLIEIGKGLDWKLAGTGTPAPNDRIEYANHAVLMDAYPNVNAFLATFFVNRGQVQNRWELKPHALGPFYRALSHWCIFLSDPSVYGWKDNTDSIPPIHTRIHDVPMTREQIDCVRIETGELTLTNVGGIGKRSILGRIGKGVYRGKRIATNKPSHINELIDSWRMKESTIVWCLYDEEQRILAESIPGSLSIDGKTPIKDRITAIDLFKTGTCRVLITKPKIMGFGLNLQVCTRMIFSGLEDSYEQFYQAVKRSNRYGSEKPLHVHIPVTDVEEPMVQNVIRKSARVEKDTREQEMMFRQHQ